MNLLPFSARLSDKMLHLLPPSFLEVLLFPRQGHAEQFKKSRKKLQPITNTPFLPFMYKAGQKSLPYVAIMFKANWQKW